MRAEREGVAVPELVEVGQAGPDAAVLVTRTVAGRPLAALSADELDDDCLHRVWTSVAKLQDAGLAHGNLDARHVWLRDDGTVMFVGLRAASSAAPPPRLGGDVATLLYSTAAIVGDERAVDAAIAVLGKAAMAANVPYIQQVLVPRETRKGAKGVKKTFDALRAAVAAKTDVEVPVLFQLRRVSRRSAVMFAAAAFGIWFLIGMVGDPADLIDELKGANGWWILLGFGFWMVVELGYSISMLGAIPPANEVPFGPLTLLQVASAFLNLITSGMIAQFVMNTRFLQKRGVEVPTAVSASAIPPIVYTVVQIIVILLTASAAKGQVALSDVGGGDDSGSLRVVLIIILVMVLGVGIVLAIPKLVTR